MSRAYEETRGREQDAIQSHVAAVQRRLAINDLEDSMELTQSSSSSSSWSLAAGERPPRRRELQQEDDEEEIMIRSSHEASESSHHDLDSFSLDSQDDYLLSNSQTRGLNPSWVKVGIILAILTVFAVITGIALHYGVRGSVSDTGLDRDSQVFVAAVTPAGARATLQTLTQRPHIAGSIHDYNTATFIKSEFEKLGMDDVKLERFQTLLNRPLDRRVELLDASGAVSFSCELKEPAVAEDPTSNDPDSVEPFHGFSPSGDAIGQLVYVNYGRYEDYTLLDAMNVNLTNKIVIARYGKGFRGNKVKLAQQRGAAGVLIYSDPADDGAIRGPVYPRGPWRPLKGVQRGSIYTGFGDPETPLWPSTPAAPRLEDLSQSEVSLIPSQPLSAFDAEPLLRALSQRKQVAAPAAWQGGFSFPYAIIADSDTKVHMQIHMNYSVHDIWNVIGTIRGQVESDRVVMLGAHRDAWTLGAGDPGTGTAVLVEAARGFGAMLKSGWRPRRSIVFASWDAEEYGLIGSTEFAERHSKWLSSSAVAYLNVDVAVSSSPLFDISSVPSLTQLITSVASRVLAPSDAIFNGEKLSTVLDMWRANYIHRGHTPNETLSPGILGSGSDFTPMLQHLGISSMDMEIVDGNGSYTSVYHSNYDSFHWMSTFGDPTFEYHATVARMFGLVAKDLVDAEILTFNYTDYALGLDTWVSKAASRVIKESQSVKIDWTPLLRAVRGFSAVAKSVEVEKTTLVGSGRELQIRGLNDRLVQTERSFLDHKGLLGRPFLKHIIFAPGIHDSYSGTALPTINDAILNKDWATLQFQIKYVALFVEAATETLSGQLGLG